MWRLRPASNGTAAPAPADTRGVMVGRFTSEFLSKDEDRGARSGAAGALGNAAMSGTERARYGPSVSPGGREGRIRKGNVGEGRPIDKMKQWRKTDSFSLSATLRL